MKTAIIILNYKNLEDTINCVESVYQHNSAPIKIVVVDNGSSDENVITGVANYLQHKFAEYVRIDDSTVLHSLPVCTYVVSKTNDGYARGNNKGLALAYADPEVEYVMVLNNDILFVEDIIPKLVNFINIHKNVGIVSPLLLKRDGKSVDYNCARKCPRLKYEFLKHLFLGKLCIFDKKNIILEGNDALLSHTSIPIELPSGSCMLLKKSVAQKIGMFDHNTFLYCEENILYKQTKSSDLENYLIPSLRCIHLGSQTMKKTTINLFTMKCGFDSMQYYLKEYEKAPYLFRVFIRMANSIELKLAKLKLSKNKK